MKTRRTRSEAGAATAKEPTRVGSETDVPTITDAEIESDARKVHAAQKEMSARSEARAEEMIRGTSGALRDELQKSNDEVRDAEHERRRIEFRSVQKKRSPIRPDLGKIVETHWTEDLYGEWNRIRGLLRVGEQRSEHGHVMLALDEARKIAEDAYGLMVTAILEAKRWETANEIVFAAMWTQARIEAERERKQMGFSKAVTDQDVRSKCAVLYPDEWLAQEVDREKVKLTVDRMKNLSKVAADKADDVRAMLKGQRG